MPLKEISRVTKDAVWSAVVVTSIQASCARCSPMELVDCSAKQGATEIRTADRAKRWMWKYILARADHKANGVIDICAIG